MAPRRTQIPSRLRRLIALADRDPARAVELTHQAGDADRDAWLLFARGWALLCWERLAQARAALKNAQGAFVAAPGGLGATLCEYGLLLVDQRQLARQGLDGELAAIAERIARAGEARLAWRARLDQARQLNVLGRTQESEAVLARLESAEPPPAPLDRARLLRVRAVGTYLRGDYLRAIALLDEAEGAFRRARQGLEQARCWFERAAVAVYQEQLETALAFCERAGEVFDAHDLPMQRAFCLKAAGLASIRLGRYDQALRQTRRALELFQELGREHDAGACTLNLGNIYFHSGSWAAALAAYTRAEEHFVAAGMVGHRLLAQRNRAMVYRASGRPAEAGALLTNLETQAAQLGYKGELAEVWAVQAALLADEGRAAEAARRYGEALERFAELGNMTASAECRLELGWLALRAGEQREAAAHFAAAGPTLEGRGHHAWRVRYGQGRCAELAGDTEAALGHYAAASATVATLRRRLASESLSSQLYAQARQLHFDALLLAAARGEAREALRFAEGQRALTLQQLMLSQPHSAGQADQEAHEELRLRVEALLERGEQAGAALDGALEAYDQLLLRMRHRAAPSGLDLDLTGGAPDEAAVRQACRAAFGDDWTALIYAFAGDSLLSVSLTPEGAALDRQPFDATLRRLLDRASQPAYRYYTYGDLPLLQGLAARPWAGQTDLGERLLPAQVRARLGGEHRLLVIPAGPLHLLPWGALRVDGAWLAERAVVQLLPSLTLAPALLGRRAAGERALAVGCSAFHGRAADLPAVDDELAAVLAAWPGPGERRFEDEATRTTVLAAASRSDLALLHIASHGQLIASRGLAAHVKLWDGNLLLPEIMGLGLAGALTVLSACDGAAADVLPGEEVLSLTWAFLAGGAGAVVASLWPLSDRLAPAVMARFYAELRGGHDPALALTRAQRAMIQGGGEDGEAGPQVWAALQVVGGCAARG